MRRSRLCFPQILLASALALSATAVAEPPPPATPSPLPMPYPNIAARDPASGLPTGKRMHKPYTVTAQRLEASAISWTASALDSSKRLSSDPEEGGQVTAAKTKPIVSEIDVTHRTDSSSPKPLASTEGDTGTPPPSGSATITVARNACASGQHIKDATISVRGRTFVLHDVEVAGCTANADGTDTCTLTYASLVE